MCIFYSSLSLTHLPWSLCSSYIDQLSDIACILSPFLHTTTIILAHFVYTTHSLTHTLLTVTVWLIINRLTECYKQFPVPFPTYYYSSYPPLCIYILLTFTHSHTTPQSLCGSYIDHLSAITCTMSPFPHTTTRHIPHFGVYYSLSHSHAIPVTV